MVNENTAISHVEKDEKGKTKKWTEESRDSDGKLISKRVDEYSYYPTGEVDVIVQRIYDADNKLISEKEIKHYLDGRQPTVTKK